MIFAVIIISVLVFIILTVFLCIASRGRTVYSPESKGVYGENIVAQILGETKFGEQYVINDLLFTTPAGSSCQIDHIYINRFGIWVIETKNYAGYIYGDEKQRKWTQVLAYGHTKNRFYNPIKQNAMHIYHLSKYLNENHIFHNIVVILPRADISHITSDCVCSIYQLSSTINQDTHICLTVDQMEYYYHRLLELKNHVSISKEEHIENIYRTQMQLQEGICPRCGGKLVLRNGKNGQFYGCSNYPNCKFTKNIF